MMLLTSFLLGCAERRNGGFLWTLMIMMRTETAHNRIAENIAARSKSVMNEGLVHRPTEGEGSTADGNNDRSVGVGRYERNETTVTLTVYLLQDTRSNR
jgi:hypothetical protein